MNFITCGPFDNLEILSIEDYQERQDFYNSISIDHSEWRIIDELLFNFSL